MDDPGVQAMFKRSGHNNLSILIKSHDYYELGQKNALQWKYLSYIQTEQFQRCIKSLSRQKFYRYDPQ